MPVHTYGVRAYTGAQLLERQNPPKRNHPTYNLTFNPEQLANFDAFCANYHLGGSHALPTPVLLCELAHGLQLLHVDEDPAVVKELLRRLAKRVEGLRAVNTRVPDGFWDTAVHGPVATLVQEAFTTWQNEVQTPVAGHVDKHGEGEVQKQKQKQKDKSTKEKTTKDKEDVKQKHGGKAGLQFSSGTVKGKPQRQLQEGTRDIDPNNSGIRVPAVTFSPAPAIKLEPTSAPVQIQEEHNENEDDDDDNEPRLETMRRDYEALRAAEKDLTKRLRELGV